MEGEEEVSVTFPEDLVERILAMVPFPYIFKARTLSKSWLARLSSISSRDDETTKRLAISFQKRVGEWSIRWKTFCPVFVGRKDLMAYDRESQHWRRIPCLSFLPENHLNLKRKLEGALFFSINPLDLGPPNTTPLEDHSVANILTRRWTQLPPRPRRDADPYALKLEIAWAGNNVIELVITSSGTYKVIELYEHSDGLLCLALVYDSKLGSWSTLDVPRDFKILSNGVCLNGVVYWLVGPKAMPVIGTGLLAFNVEEETFKVIQMPRTDTPLQFVSLVVCGGSLLMVVYDAPYSAESMIVLKIDPGSRLCWEVTRGSALDRVGSLKRRPVSDGDCIFFLMEDFMVKGNEGLAYNVRKDEWSCFTIPAVVTQSMSEYSWNDFTSFEPGLSPFVAV